MQYTDNIQFRTQIQEIELSTFLYFVGLGFFKQPEVVKEKYCAGTDSAYCIDPANGTIMTMLSYHSDALLCTHTLLQI